MTNEKSSQQSSEKVLRQLRKVQRLIKQNRITDAWTCLENIDKSSMEESDDQTKILLKDARQMLLIMMVRELKKTKTI